MKKVSLVSVALVLLSVISIISSCKKKNEAPVIVFNEPAEGEEYHLSIADSIHCEFTVTDDNSLHELSVVCTGPSGDTIFSAAPMVHDLKTYEFHGHPHPTVVGAHHIIVTAEDHDGAVTTGTRNVSVLN